MGDKPDPPEKKSEGQKSSDSKSDSSPNLLDILGIPTTYEPNKKYEKLVEPEVTKVNPYELAQKLSAAMALEINKDPNKREFSKQLDEFIKKCGKDLKSVLQYMAKHGDEFEPLKVEERDGKFIIHIKGDDSFAATATEAANAVAKDLTGKPVVEDHYFKGATLIIEPDKLYPPESHKQEKPKKIIVGRGLDGLLK